MKLLAALAIAALCLPAFGQSGQSVTLPWMPPTTWDDGSTLDPATDLQEFRVYRNGVRVASVGAAFTSYVVENVPYGESVFAVTAVAVNGEESSFSNTLTRVIEDTRKPRPPTLLDAIIAWVKSFFARWA